MPTRVQDIMTTGVINIGPEESIMEAIRIMTEQHISCVVITEGSEHKPVGIITERDLVRRVLAERRDPDSLLAKDIMTRSVTSISEEASLDDALRIIESLKIRRLPVVDSGGLVGLVTQTDIVHETMHIHAHNQRLTFHQNLQSYIIIAIAAFVVVFFIYRFLFA